jgi:hypothetical protein
MKMKPLIVAIMLFMANPAIGKSQQPIGGNSQSNSHLRRNSSDPPIETYSGQVKGKPDALTFILVMPDGYTLAVNAQKSQFFWNNSATSFQRITDGAIATVRGKRSGVIFCATRVTIDRPRSTRTKEQGASQSTSAANSPNVVSKGSVTITYGETQKADFLINPGGTTLLLSVPDITKIFDPSCQIGRVMSWPRVKVLQTEQDRTGITMCKIRVLTGQHKGKEGWLSAEHIHHRE